MRILLAQEFRLKTAISRKRKMIKIILFHESVVAPLFMPFLAYMGPFLVIFWVLEVAHSDTFLPKYAPRSGKDWEKRKFTCTSKMTMYM